MELTTFGNIIRYAVDLETELGRLAAAAPSLGLAAPQAELLATLGAAASKTIKTMERARQENITECVLEPIRDFRSEDFDFARPTSLEAASVGPYLLTLLATTHRFYSGAGAKLTMHDFRGVLGRFAKERESFLANARGVFPQP
jgi:hypothetical protein